MIVQLEFGICDQQCLQEFLLATHAPRFPWTSAQTGDYSFPLAMTAM
jgi:hypothetical protein